MNLPIHNNIPLDKLVAMAPECGYPQIHIDHLASIINLFCELPPDEEGWTHLSSVYMKKRTWLYADCLRFLIEQEYVKEPDNNIGIVGEATKRYKLSVTSDNGDKSIKLHKVRSRPIIKNFAERERNLRRKNEQAGICHLTKWIDKLTINAKEAIVASQQAYQEKINNPELVEKYIDWNKVTGEYEEKRRV